MYDLHLEKSVSFQQTGFAILNLSYRRALDDLWALSSMRPRVTFSTKAAQYFTNFLSWWRSVENRRFVCLTEFPFLSSHHTALTLSCSKELRNGTPAIPITQELPRQFTHEGILIHYFQNRICYRGSGERILARARRNDRNHAAASPHTHSMSGNILRSTSLTSAAEAPRMGRQIWLAGVLC